MNDSTPTPKPASHDPSTPPALLHFMCQHWRAPLEAPATPRTDAPTRQARRRAVAAQFPGEWLVIPTGTEQRRANDTYYRFRPGTDFFYLTGHPDPDGVLLLRAATADGPVEELLFVEPSGRSDARFFTDRKKGELWVGPRLGVEETAAAYGLQTRSLHGLDAALQALTGPVRVLRGLDPAVDAARPATTDDAAPNDAALAAALSELRLLKDAAELSELHAVIDATKRGFEDVIRALPRARSEREVEGIFNLRARVEGNDVGYGTIAASGANACVLHWTKNNGPLRPGELLLLDAGVEGESLYTADITRTLPISGRFTPEQRAIYTLVWEAQKAAMALVKPGVDFMAPNKEAMRVLAEGLHALGILPMTPEEALKDEHQFYRRYTLHNISHMLGMDVHDCAQARKETYKFGQLKPGMVFTVEPGLYFQLDDLTVPERYRGIGVRLEDDIVVTESGYDNLSQHIPIAPDDVEAWMASLWQG